MKKYFLILVLLLIIFVPHVSSAVTDQNIQLLQSQVAALTLQLAALQGGQSVGCVTITKNLYPGVRDTSPNTDVTKLQKFLKAQGDYTYPTITGFYGSVTEQAVKKFQKRMNIVSSGTGATTGYGLVGTMTRKKIKDMTCGVAQLPANQAHSQPTYHSMGSFHTDFPGGTNIPTTPVGQGDGEPPVGQQAAMCNDHIDNDGDGHIDYPADPGCSSTSDNDESNSKLLLVQEGISNHVWQVNQSSNLGAVSSIMIYPVASTYGHPGIIDIPVFRQEIHTTVTDPNYDGFVTIDLEPGFMQYFVEQLPGSILYIQATEQMVAAVQTVKQELPNARVGVYGFPNVAYYINHNYTWDNPVPQSLRDAEFALAIAATPLMNAVDFYSPSYYDQNPTAQNPISVASDVAWIQASTQFLSSSNLIADKPVLSFVAPRFFSTTGNGGMYNYQLVPVDELQSQGAYAAIQNGADGVIWWGADRYFYWCAFLANPQQQLDSCGGPADNNQIHSAFSGEMPQGMNSDTYFDLIHEDILRLFSETIFGIPYDGNIRSAIQDLINSSPVDLDVVNHNQQPQMLIQGKLKGSAYIAILNLLNIIRLQFGL